MARYLEGLERHRAGRLSCLEAAEFLGISERHFRRLRTALSEDVGAACPPRSARAKYSRQEEFSGGLALQFVVAIGDVVMALHSSQRHRKADQFLDEESMPSDIDVSRRKRPLPTGALTVIACFPMAEQETLLPRKRRGPAPTGKGHPVVARMQPDLLAALDTFRSASEGNMTRPEAVRTLVRNALIADGHLQNHLATAETNEGMRPDQLNAENDG